MVNVTGMDLGSVYSNVTTESTAHITGLDPGRIFTITVTAVAGNVKETSEQYKFATSKFNVLRWKLLAVYVVQLL